MHDEGVTHSAGVPTVWLAMFAHMDATGIGYGKLHRVFIGGSACPRAMIARFMKAGIDVGHAWGMTDTSPSGPMRIRPWNWDEMSIGERFDLVPARGCPPFGAGLPDSAGAGQGQTTPRGPRDRDTGRRSGTNTS